ncbi:MAG: phosphate starvation-inducible protein PhoH [Elusimicrobia bacterium RIFOXYA12_FULL_51_18]|nr:MAG: phosphate starvation-inducible protein PhoH [Elusimicrobia bacterium RIFOXYA12_FULL_51_18]OGS32729.1 MAG: phosphate starvation-inducible protein PhoH [Elusimicrobia bacterium RIFOXYA2_FULL_53_38]
MKKIYILDTNVLIHDPMSFTKFEDNSVVIPISVIEELDTFKSVADERGKAARIVSRKLDDFRKFGKLNAGVKMENGGMLIVDLDHEQVLPKEFLLGNMDNRILNSALWFKKKKNNAVLVTKDINLRLKAEAVGINSEDYEAGKVKVDEIYPGLVTIEKTADFVDKFYKEKSAKNTDPDLVANEFVIFKAKEDPKKSAMGRVSPSDTSVIKMLSPESSPWGIRPLNKEQRCAMDLLLDENVKLVTMIGSAGTGKTLMSLACGLQKAVEESVYRRLIICRPIVPVGKDIGFIPGTKEEKLSTWMGAIYDNLEFIMDKRHQDDAMQKFEYLLQNGKIEIASVTHIRGRSLPKQYMIVDDAQNLTPHEIKTILSRAGEGTKVVVTGDPYQIDNPYLDIASNGLMYIVDRFKGQKLYGHLTFTKTERSELAGLVAELM